MQRRRQPNRWRRRRSLPQSREPGWRLKSLVHRSNRWGNHAAASECKEQAARCNEVSVKALHEREQGCGKDDVDDPACTESLLKSNCGHELFAGQMMPRSYEGDRRYDARIKQDPDDDGHPNGSEES